MILYRPRPPANVRPTPCQLASEAAAILDAAQGDRISRRFPPRDFPELYLSAELLTAFRASRRHKAGLIGRILRSLRGGTV